METHDHCYICKGSMLTESDYKAKLIDLMRQVENRPGSPRALGARSQIKDIKERLASLREDQKRHFSTEPPREHS